MNIITYIQRGHSNSQRLAQDGLSCVVALKCVNDGSLQLT